MELAMEASPESFGQVIMLYINCKVTFAMSCHWKLSQPWIIAFEFEATKLWRWMVTMWRPLSTPVPRRRSCLRYLLSFLQGHTRPLLPTYLDIEKVTFNLEQAAAERCGIMRLVDTRWAGIAKGVGTQKIIGLLGNYSWLEPWLTNWSQSLINSKDSCHILHQGGYTWLKFR